MADLLPTLPSDEDISLQDDNDDDGDDMEESFEFGGILGEDSGAVGPFSVTGWNYTTAMKMLEPEKVARTQLTDLIAAKRKAKQQSSKQPEATVSPSSGSEDSSCDSRDEELHSCDEDQEAHPEEKDTIRTRLGNDEQDNDEDFSDDDSVEAVKAVAFYDKQVICESTTQVEVFNQLNLSRPLLRGVAAMGFVEPTAIQASVVPVALAGRDICASAVTGSGKTAAFLLPTMERILHRHLGTTKAIILAPTRELAAQCLGMLSTLAQFTKIRASLIVGGTKNVKAQEAELRSRPDIVVATPGRLLDHITNTPGFTLDDIEFLVLDEADRLLDLGFQDEVHEIIRACPAQRQTLLFSATMNTKVDDLIKLSMKRPIRVKVSSIDANPMKDLEVAPRLEQEFVRIRSGNEGVNREAILLALLTRTFTKQVIVFFDLKSMAHRMMILCGLCGIACTELHGNLTQQQRLQALEEFRNGEVDVLLATDLAARGLDITGVKSVINYEMPTQLDAYIHRIGRTARAGRGGKSCTMIGEGRRHLMKELMKDAEAKASKSKSHAETATIRSRAVPPAVVAHFAEKIQSLETDIEEVLEAEKVAKMDRIAEMEAMKAQNLIEHADEIGARPKREWFASNRDKKSAKELAKEKQQEILEKVGTGKHRMNRKKRRAREAKAALLETEEGSDGEELPVQPKVNFKAIARAARKEEEQRAREQSKMSINDHFEAKRKKSKPKGAQRTQAIGDGSLFGEEKVSFSGKSSAKPKDDGVKASSYDFQGYIPDRKIGKKRAHHAFKSKSKYKRRKK